MGVVKFPLNFRPPPPLYNAASAPAMIQDFLDGVGVEASTKECRFAMATELDSVTITNIYSMQW